MYQCSALNKRISDYSTIAYVIGWFEMRPGHRTVIACMLALWCCAVACQSANDRPATWSYLHASTITPACTTAGCHSALTAIAGVNLSDKDGAYTILTGRICGAPERPQDPPRNYVTPFSSKYSQLIYQLRGSDDAGRPYRNVMPPDAPLSEVEIDLIARWIDEGAQCN